MQFIACLAHLYGVSLYYSTSLVEGAQGHVSYSRPEPIYFWLYFVGFNMPWVIVPSSKLGRVPIPKPPGITFGMADR